MGVATHNVIGRLAASIGGYGTTIVFPNHEFPAAGKPAWAPTFGLRRQNFNLPAYFAYDTASCLRVVSRDIAVDFSQVGESLSQPAQAHQSPSVVKN
jgi:hypothetical protein